jgi:hypothetical protein
LVPGGWVEFQEKDLEVYSDDGTLTDDHSFKQLHTYFQAACSQSGRCASPGPRLPAWLKDAGFVNIHHRVIKLPYGLWPKDERLVGPFELSLS